MAYYYNTNNINHLKNRKTTEYNWYITNNSYRLLQKLSILSIMKLMILDKIDKKAGKVHNRANSWVWDDIDERVGKVNGEITRLVINGINS